QRLSGVLNALGRLAADPWQLAEQGRHASIDPSNPLDDAGHSISKTLRPVQPDNIQLAGSVHHPANRAEQLLSQDSRLIARSAEGVTETKNLACDARNRRRQLYRQLPPESLAGQLCHVQRVARLLNFC